MEIQVSTAAATVVKVADAKVTAATLEKSIKQTRMFLVQTSGEQNPQIVAEVVRARERLAVMEAVLHSLKGNHVDLRVYAN
jgi:hypothetical protein